MDWVTYIRGYMRVIELKNIFVADFNITISHDEMVLQNYTRCGSAKYRKIGDYCIVYNQQGNVNSLDTYISILSICVLKAHRVVFADAEISEQLRENISMYTYGNWVAPLNMTDMRKWFLYCCDWRGLFSSQKYEFHSLSHVGFSNLDVYTKQFSQSLSAMLSGDIEDPTFAFSGGVVCYGGYNVTHVVPDRFIPKDIDDYHRLSQYHKIGDWVDPLEPKHMEGIIINAQAFRYLWGILNPINTKMAEVFSKDIVSDIVCDLENREMDRQKLLWKNSFPSNHAVDYTYSNIHEFPTIETENIGEINLSYSSIKKLNGLNGMKLNFAQNCLNGCDSLEEIEEPSDWYWYNWKSEHAPKNPILLEKYAELYI